MQEGNTLTQTLVDMSDMVQRGLLKGLGYNPEGKGNEVGSRVSGVSRLTGDAKTIGASTINSEATQNWVLCTKEYAKQLADTHKKNAKQAAEIHTLKLQIHQLTEMLAGQNQQGGPHLRGSGAGHSQDVGSGVALQGG